MKNTSLNNLIKFPQCLPSSQNKYYVAATGSWPALWMLPEGSVYGGWCLSGELDVMEHVNKNTTFHGTAHYGGNVPNHWEGCTFSGGERGAAVQLSVVGGSDRRWGRGGGRAVRRALAVLTCFLGWSRRSSVFSWAPQAALRRHNGRRLPVHMMGGFTPLLRFRCTDKVLSRHQSLKQLERPKPKLSQPINRLPARLPALAARPPAQAAARSRARPPPPTGTSFPWSGTAASCAGTWTAN